MDVFSALGDAVLLAHVLYGLPIALPAGGARVTLRNGDDFGPSDAPPRPDRLTAVRVVSSTRVMPLVPIGDPAGGVHVDVPSTVSLPAWVVVESPPAFIELAAPAFARYLEHEGLTHVRDGRRSAGTSTAPGREVYSKHVKAAVGSGRAGTRLPAIVVGLPVELVPVSADALSAGGTLELELRLDGAPVGDAQVRVHHAEAPDRPPREVECARTDATGRVRIRLDTPGLWRCHAVVMTPNGNPSEADWRSRWACLTFQV